MKASHWILILGGTILALDVYAQATASNPIPAIDPIVGNIRSFYAPLDDKLPVPLWVAAVGTGAALWFFGY